MPTVSIVPGYANTIAANTVYALPVGPYRVQANGIITFSSTVDGAYTTLTGANSAPGVLTSGGFIQAAAERLVVAKKINQLIKSYSNLVGRSNPLSYWRLGEQYGNTVYDWVGQNHLAKGSTVVLGTAGPLGDSNFAITTDGTSNGVCSLVGPNTWSGGTALSFEAWINNPAFGVGHEMVISLGGQGLYLSFEGGKPIMSIHTGTQLANKAIAAVVVNTWYHIASTWESGDKLRLYVNGLEVAAENTTVRTGTLSSSANIYIGAFNGSSLFWSGIIDDVALYMRKLTATEIYNHYAGKSVS